jgi:hypothetical protein
MMHHTPTRSKRSPLLLALAAVAVWLLPLLAGCGAKDEKPDPNYYEGPMKSKNPEKRGETSGPGTN